MTDKNTDEIKKVDPDYASGVAAFESKSFTHAMRLLLRHAEAGNDDAQHKVAILYQNGLGVVTNEDQAFRWMSASAEQGNAIAMHGMGFMYMEGECAEQDLEKAVFWFKKAADEGLVGSMTTLAMIYEEGRGAVEKNPEEAKRLYKLAGF